MGEETDGNFIFPYLLFLLFLLPKFSKINLYPIIYAKNDILKVILKWGYLGEWELVFSSR